LIRLGIENFVWQGKKKKTGGSFKLSQKKRIGGKIGHRNGAPGNCVGRGKCLSMKCTVKDSAKKKVVELRQFHQKSCAKNWGKDVKKKHETNPPVARKSRSGGSTRKEKNVQLRGETWGENGGKDNPKAGGKGTVSESDLKSSEAKKKHEKRGTERRPL